MSHYIKFSCERVGDEIASFRGLAELNACRRKLVGLHLIGVDPKGIGFGNLSIRDGATNHFYITGSATGGLPEMMLTDCAKVVGYSVERNSVRFEGAAIPSSESLTHAAVYESDAEAVAIIHCHDEKLWSAVLNRAPTTSNAAEYGTPKMANEIMRLFTNTGVRSRKIIAMAGHKGGIIVFGKDLEEAFAVLIRERKNLP